MSTVRSTLDPRLLGLIGGLVALLGVAGGIAYIWFVVAPPSPTVAEIMPVSTHTYSTGVLSSEFKRGGIFDRISTLTTLPSSENIQVGNQELGKSDLTQLE